MEEGDDERTEEAALALTRAVAAVDETSSRIRELGDLTSVS